MSKHHKKKHTAHHKADHQAKKDNNIGLSDVERLKLMLREGTVISILSIAINLIVKYLEINYLRWTILLGMVGIVLINVITYFRFRERMVDEESRSVLPLANAFALASNIVLSSIFVAYNDSILSAIRDIFYKTTFTGDSVEGSFIVNMMTIARIIPTINLGHIIFVFGLLIYSMLRKALSNKS